MQGFIFLPRRLVFLWNIVLVCTVGACPGPSVVDAAYADAARVDAAFTDAVHADIEFGDSEAADLADSATQGLDIRDDAQATDQTATDQVGAEQNTALDAGTGDAGDDDAGVAVWLAAAEDAVTSYLIDANEGAYNLFWGDNVYLGRHWDVAHVSYSTALRFSNVPIPAGAVVDHAVLELSPANDVDANHNLWINIYAELNADSPAFVVENYESGRPDQRARSTAKIDHWLLRCNDECTDLTEYDCPQRMRDCWQAETRYQCPKDLAALVQEVVDLPAWQAGNALTFLLVNAAIDQDGSNYLNARGVTGFDVERGANYRPKLILRYHLR